MLTDNQGRRLWIVDERGGHAPVFSHKDIQNRPRGGAEPDWWVVAKDKDWTPPEPRTLLSLGAAADGSATGSGGGTKIGAGHKPQPYGWHGYYGETGGGASSGPVYRGKVTPPHEVRGKVAPPAKTGQVVSPPSKAPAEVTWKNDEAGRGPTHEKLAPQMRETVENLRKDNPQLDSINVNSGRRDGETGPHAEGRAVDINKVNGIPVKDLGKAQGEEGERARQAAKNMEEQAKKDGNVNQVLGPTGCWEKGENRRWRQLDPEIPRDQGLINGHKDHYHINVYRK
ncbi:MAG: hypothetical protein KKF77_07400 [Proteobacteria bacterium]|nr:hypothetical protein [Pseudomonadota bacterium]